jgi:hypothetical protein
MGYVMNSFHHESSIRKFLFDRIDADYRRTSFTVCVDLGMIRKYKISLQELPLLCRYLLEGQSADGQIRVLTFTEADMQGHADRRTAALRAAAERSAHRKRPAGGIA